MRKQIAILQSVPDEARDPAELKKWADIVASGEEAERDLLRDFPKDTPRRHAFDVIGLPELFDVVLLPGVFDDDANRAVGKRNHIIAMGEHYQQRAAGQRKNAAFAHRKKVEARAHAVFSKNHVLLARMNRPCNPLSTNAVATRLHGEWHDLPASSRLKGEEHLTARGDDHPAPTVRTLINWLGEYGTNFV